MWTAFKTLLPYFKTFLWFVSTLVLAGVTFGYVCPALISQPNTMLAVIGGLLFIAGVLAVSLLAFMGLISITKWPLFNSLTGETK